MFNVLPDNLKAEIKKQYRLRRLVVICLFVLFIQISFLVFLFPSWLISTYKENDLNAQIDYQNNSNLSKNANVVLQTISSTNQKLDIINTVFEYPKIVPIFKTVISYKTSGIKLRNFTYTVNATTSATVILEGVSNTRETLVTFVKNLQSSFPDVSSPVSNLAKDKDIDFVVNINVNQ